MLLIETNTPAAWEAMSGYLSGFGYSLARRLAVNSLYVRDPRDVERIQSISVKCWIEPTPHPFGAELTPQQHVTGYQVKRPGRGQAGTQIPAETPHPSLVREVRAVHDDEPAIEHRDGRW
ncbi:MAG: hypothetical protein HND48_21410 [Chloroflexi bacterium]|nr:hypothetical protein [Chloroflexota bacterium]